MLDSFLSGQEQAKHIQIEKLVVVLSSNVAQWGEFIDAGIVDQDVDLTEQLPGFRKQVSNLGLVGDIGLHGDRLPPLLVILATTLSAPDLLLA